MACGWGGKAWYSGERWDWSYGEVALACVFNLCAKYCSRAAMLDAFGDWEDNVYE